MELPSFVKAIESRSELDVVLEYGPFDGTRIMADLDQRCLVHRWSNAMPDTLDDYNDVAEALEDEVNHFTTPDGNNEYSDVAAFLDARGGQRYDGCGNPDGYALDETAAEKLRIWITDAA